MPALPNVPKVVRLDFFLTKGADTRVRDRMYVQYSGAGPSVADMATFVLNVSGAWGTNIAPLEDTATSLTSVQGTDLTSATGAQAINSIARPGTRAGTGLPAAVSPVIRFKVARRYRGGHPRMYVPAGVGTDTTNAQQWTSAFLTALLNGWQAFITNIGTGPPASFGTLSHVNVSYFQGFTNKTFPSGRVHAVPSLRIGGPAVDTVISYSINPNFASQRRRNLQSA